MYVCRYLSVHIYLYVCYLNRRWSLKRTALTLCRLLPLSILFSACIHTLAYIYLRTYADLIIKFLACVRINCIYSCPHAPSPVSTLALPSPSARYSLHPPCMCISHVHLFSTWMYLACVSHMCMLHAYTYNTYTHQLFICIMTDGLLTRPSMRVISLDAWVHLIQECGISVGAYVGVHVGVYVGVYGGCIWAWEGCMVS
jgi:hypothetical protein